MANPFVEPLLRAAGEDPASLKRAYRSLCLRLHPDSSGRGGEDFILAQDAYAEALRILEGRAQAQRADRHTAPRDAASSPVTSARAEARGAALYYGVAYWKYKSPESRLAFRLGEFASWAKLAPEDPFDWPDGYGIYGLPPEARPWTLHLKRQRQVAPLATEDEVLYTELRRFEDHLRNRLEDEHESGEAGARKIAALFLAALRWGFVSLGKAAGPEREGATTIGSSFPSALRELGDFKVGIAGPFAFKTACLRLARALGSVIEGGWSWEEPTGPAKRGSRP
jgi:hypothetical protein